MDDFTDITMRDIVCKLSRHGFDAETICQNTHHYNKQTSRAPSGLAGFFL